MWCPSMLGMVDLLMHKILEQVYIDLNRYKLKAYALKIKFKLPAVTK